MERGFALTADTGLLYGSYHLRPEGAATYQSRAERSAALDRLDVAAQTETPKHRPTETPKHRPVALKHRNTETPPCGTETTPKLPPFAKQWMQQWRRAARELPQVRASELRALGSAQVLMASEVMELPSPQPAAETSGLVSQQRWFMRQRLLELEAIGRSAEPSASRRERSAR